MRRRLSFAQVEQTIVEYAVRAKANKLTLDEMTGGTFTISNGGVYGSLLSTPSSIRLKAVSLGSMVSKSGRSLSMVKS